LADDLVKPTVLKAVLCYTAGQTKLVKQINAFHEGKYYLVISSAFYFAWKLAIHNNLVGGYNCTMYLYYCKAFHMETQTF
jgi:hypothetical protein